MRFSANLGFLWKELPLDQRIARAAACGFDAVEIHDDWQACDLAQLKAALARSGLPLEALNSNMADNAGLAAVANRHGEARAAVEKAVEAAAALGARAVHVTAGKAAHDAASHAAYIASLRHACSLARPHGLTVLIEPISHAAIPGFYLSSLEQADSALAELADPALKLMFDCFHVATMGHDLLAAFTARIGNIGHVQIAGFPGRGEPSTGKVDYGVLLPAMVKAGYAGSFGAEYRPAGTVEEGLGWMGNLRQA